MRGKLSHRVPRKARDWHDVLVTIITTDFTHDEVMAMTPRQRKEAQQDAARARQAPGYRNWGKEMLAEWNAWRDSKAPDKIWDWRQHLESIGRLDLYRDPEHPESRRELNQRLKLKRENER